MLSSTELSLLKAAFVVICFYNFSVIKSNQGWDGFKKEKINCALLETDLL